MTEGDVPGLVEPVAEYDHTGPNDTTNGEAGIGGFVYRGSALPQLAGRYVFGDYSHEFDEGIASGRLFTLGISADVLHRVRILLVDGADDFDSGSAKTPTAKCTCSPTRPARSPAEPA